VRSLATHIRLVREIERERRYRQSLHAVLFAFRLLCEAFR